MTHGQFDIAGLKTSSAGLVGLCTAVVVVVVVYFAPRIGSAHQYVVLLIVTCWPFRCHQTVQDLLEILPRSLLLLAETLGKGGKQINRPLTYSPISDHRSIVDQTGVVLVCWRDI